MSKHFLNTMIKYLLWQVAIFNILNCLFSNSHNYPLIWVQLSSPFCRWANWGTEKLSSFPRPQLSGQDGIRTCLSDLSRTLFTTSQYLPGAVTHDRRVRVFFLSDFTFPDVECWWKEAGMFWNRLASLRLSVVFKVATRGARYPHRERKRKQNKTKHSFRKNNALSQLTIWILINQIRNLSLSLEGLSILDFSMT